MQLDGPELLSFFLPFASISLDGLSQLTSRHQDVIVYHLSEKGQPDTDICYETNILEAYIVR
jgi:hypothetical protein